MHPIFLEAQNIFPYTQKLRRDFHSHPELGFQEFRTANIVGQELKNLGFQVKSGVAGTGVVGLLEGANPGPTVMLRFDMDALPIEERSEVEYQSQNQGVMHACGHDGHTAIGLSVARLLESHRSELSGVVKFVFQPAEEGLGGASKMISEGVLKGPHPDFVLALHLWNEKEIGTLGITSGPVMAAGDRFQISVFGTGGHGAVPHRAVDPILTASQIISSLQSIVSRNIPPLETAVISVTSIHGGEIFNVIPPHVEMQGTIRTFDKKIRQNVLDRFDQIVTATAQAFNCTVEITIESLTPPLVNDEALCGYIRDTAALVLPEIEIDQDYRTMGSEDMAFLMQNIPGCFIFVGSANHELGLSVPHHHPCFDIDENSLIISVALLTSSVIQLLK